MGYQFAQAQVGAICLALQRRTCAWMWAIRSDVAAAPAVGEGQAILNALEEPQPVPLDKLF